MGRLVRDSHDKCGHGPEPHLQLDTVYAGREELHSIDTRYMLAKGNADWIQYLRFRYERRLGLILTRLTQALVQRIQGLWMSYWRFCRGKSYGRWR